MPIDELEIIFDEQAEQRELAFAKGLVDKEKKEEKKPKEITIVNEALDAFKREETRKGLRPVFNNRSTLPN